MCLLRKYRSFLALTVCSSVYTRQTCTFLAAQFKLEQFRFSESINLQQSIDPGQQPWCCISHLHFHLHSFCLSTIDVGLIYLRIKCGLICFVYSKCRRANVFECYEYFSVHNLKHQGCSVFSPQLGNLLSTWFPGCSWMTPQCLRVCIVRDTCAWRHKHS